MVLAEGDAMMTEEDIDLVVLGHLGSVQVRWDHSDMDLLWKRRAVCNHSGHPQTVEAVTQEEDIDLVVLGHLGSVQVRREHSDMDLLWKRRAVCNYSGHPRTVEAVNREEDSSCPVAGHLGEEDMRSDDPLLPSSCLCIIRKVSKLIGSW